MRVTWPAMRMTPLQPWIEARAGTAALDLPGLHRYQLERLQQTLDLARVRSPFYRRTLATAPTLLRGLDEVSRLPFTTPRDVAERGRQMLCVGQDEVERIVTLDTSGTTGPPKRLYFTRADQELTVDFFRVGMSTFTGPGDRVLILLPAQRPGSVGDLLAIALQRLGAHPVRHGVVVDPAAALAVLHRERIDVAVGVPTQLLALARADPTPRLKAVLLSTDHVPRAVARALARTWRCQVYGHYGMTETGLGGGVECQARQGYHLREADLYVEVVDPVTGTPLPAGSEGEVVISTLTRTGMPLLRYRTGDLSRFLPGRCPCGSWLPRLERVTRRAAGVIRLTGGGSLTLADLDEALFRLSPVRDFTAELSETPDSSARLRLALRASGPPGAVQAAAQAAVRRIPAIGPALRSGALTLAVEVLPPPDQLPPPAKRRICDRRQEVPTHA